MHGGGVCARSAFGYPWISMNIHGCPRISIGIHGYPWRKKEMGVTIISTLVRKSGKSLGVGIARPLSRQIESQIRVVEFQNFQYKYADTQNAPSIFCHSRKRMIIRETNFCHSHNFQKYAFGANQTPITHPIPARVKSCPRTRKVWWDILRNQLFWM